MDDWFEIEGKNLKDAIERACNALNTNSSHLKYEIISEGKITKIRAMKVEEDAFERKSDDEEDETEETDAEARTEDFHDADGDAEEAKPAVDLRPRKPIPPDAADKCKETLLAIIKHIDPSAEVDMKETNEAIELDVRGEKGGLLIGKYGQTLSALQYLVAKMVGIDRPDAKRLVLDSEQYLARRKESLETLAERLAQKAIRTGRAVAAEPMGASDRRVLHMYLSEDQDVSTKSIGEGSSRRVLIVPKGYEDTRPRNGGVGGGRGRGRGPNRNGGGRGRGGRYGSGSGDRDMLQTPRRRSGPPPRQHDSFDTPAEPEGNFHEEEENAPVLRSGEAVSVIDDDQFADDKE